MLNIYLPTDDLLLPTVLDAFDFPEALLGLVRYGHGHINKTYCVVCQSREGDAIRFILQRISSAAFRQPEQVMENFKNITSFLKNKIRLQGGDPDRETLSLIKTRDGKDYYLDIFGNVWRLIPFIEDTDCCQQVTPELLAASGRAFGRFQRLLSDYPVDTLHEVIENFHNTEDRFDKLLSAVESDILDRAKNVQPEIQFVLDRKEDCSILQQACRDGKLPLRVTHNDTKLNNVLIDRKTGEGVCVIDLDTTMPGLLVCDFGDAIRFGANYASENEKDLTKVNFDIDLFKAFTHGFLKETGGILTEAELEYLPWGARLVTLECGIRFLTDYLEGNRYFSICYPEQNLDRCRTQFKLVRDMEEKFDTMCDVVAKYS